MIIPDSCTRKKGKFVSFLFVYGKKYGIFVAIEVIL